MTRVVGEREERLRELERIVRIMDERNTRTGMVRARELLRELLASSPSPPDREQAVEKAARKLAAAVQRRWTGEGQCNCECCTAARELRVVLDPPPQGET